MSNWKYKFVFRDNRIAQGFFDLITGMKGLPAIDVDTEIGGQEPVWII